MPGPSEPKPAGTLLIELPILAETEKPTVAVLESFGWDGRVWPVDEGWPTDTDDEISIRALLNQANLAATMTFPSEDEGTKTQSVNVERAKGPFLMPPLPEPETEPDPHLVERLRELCKEPAIFYPIDA